MSASWNDLTERTLREIEGVNEEVAKEALRLGAAKLPIRTRVVQRIAD